MQDNKERPLTGLNCWLRRRNDWLFYLIAFQDLFKDFTRDCDSLFHVNCCYFVAAESSRNEEERIGEQLKQCFRRRKAFGKMTYW